MDQIFRWVILQLLSHPSILPIIHSGQSVPPPSPRCHQHLFSYSASQHRPEQILIFILLILAPSWGFEPGPWAACQPVAAFIPTWPKSLASGDEGLAWTKHPTASSLCLALAALEHRLQSDRMWTFYSGAQPYGHRFVLALPFNYYSHLNHLHCFTTNNIYTNSH